MAWTQEDLDQINEAIATGATKVRFSDNREVTYRSLADMRSIRDEIAAALSPSTARVRTVVTAFRRGC